MDPMDAVVANSVLAHQDDALEMEQLIYKSFKGGSVPDGSSFKGEAGAKFWFWTSKRKGLTLAGSKELMHRSLKGRSFAWFVPLVAAWPPPITCGPEDGNSFLWYFELDLARGEVSQLRVLEKALSNGYAGYAFRAVCPYPPTLTLDHV